MASCERGSSELELQMKKSGDNHSKNWACTSSYHSLYIILQKKCANTVLYTAIYRLQGGQGPGRVRKGLPDVHAPLI